MVTITSLLLAVFVSAVLVFIASSVIHMMLPIHRNDYGQLPSEDALMSAMREADVAPGQYFFPCANTPAEMHSEAMLERFRRGPVGFMLVTPNGPPSMARNLSLWFAYCLVIGVFAAYLASRTLAPDAPYMTVFRLVSTVAFLGYAGALWQGPIWYGRSASSTLKSTVDGLVYALLTAGVFGWLWP